MSLHFNCTDFDDVFDQTATWVMNNFKCNTSREDDVTIECTSRNYSNGGDIDRMAKRHPKKMTHLRSIYVEEGELDRSHNELVKTGSSDFRFKNVQHEFDHVRGGCITAMHLTNDEVTITLRASVIPWNLQFDLVMISDLLGEMGLNPSKITFKIGYIRTKVIHALYTYLHNGWTPEKICEYRFGRSCIAAYMRAKRPTCKYRNWIRFSGNVDNLRADLGIGPLEPALEAAKAKDNINNQVSQEYDDEEQSA